MSEQAPERTARPGRPAGGKPKGKENVFTRKIGPLPMWAWLAIVAAIILLWVFFSKKKTSGGSGGGGNRPRTGGFGAALVPPEIIHTIRYRRRKRRHRGDEDEDEDERDRKGHKSHKRRGDKDRDEDEDERDRQRKGHPMVRPRARGRGRPPRAELTSFKTPSRGSTPTLQEVADGLNTAPDSIIQESYGRGVPSTPAWRQYVKRSDWQAPLPHGVDLAVLAQPR